MDKRYCEICGKSNMTVKWYLIDDNAETTLCRNCMKELRESGEMAIESLLQ